MPAYDEIYGKRIYYAYPISNVVSFTYIARKHIECLKSYTPVKELDVDFLKHDTIPQHVCLAIHPFMYPFLKTSTPNLQEFIQIINRADNVVAFDTADSNRLSSVAISLVNMVDVMVVPSNFARTVYKESGATTSIEVVPHGIPDEFLNPSKLITSPTIQNLLSEKHRKGFIYVLFDIRHSGFRKGADILFKAMQRVQQKHPHVILLLKRFEGIDPYLGFLKTLKHAEVSKPLPDREYRELFDIADIATFPSRGGGFEVQALEAISRGVPTIVPKAGCFMEYIEYAIPVEVSWGVRVLDRNPIHVGVGWEASVDDLTRKLIEVVEHLEEYKSITEKNAEKVRKMYNWSRIGEQLVGVLKRYGMLTEMSKLRVRAG